MLVHKQNANFLTIFLAVIQRIFLEFRSELFSVKLHYTSWVLVHTNNRVARANSSISTNLWRKRLKKTAIARWSSYSRSKQSKIAATENYNKRKLQIILFHWKQRCSDSKDNRDQKLRVKNKVTKQRHLQTIRQWWVLVNHRNHAKRIGKVVAVRRRRDQGYAALAAWAAGTRERRQGERAAARARQKGEAGLQRRALEGWYEAASATDGDRLVQTGRRRRRLRTLREGLGRWARAAGDGQRTRAVLARAGRQRGRREVWEVLRGWRGLARHGKQVGRIGGVVAVRRRRDQGYAALAAWAAGTRERRQGERAAARARQKGEAGLQRRALEGWYEAASATDGDRLVQTGRRRRRLRTLREGLGRWARAAGDGQRTRAVLARAGRQRGRREVWEVLRGWRGLARHGKQVGRIGGVVAVRRRRDQGYAALAAWAAGTRERRQGERAAARARQKGEAGLQRRALEGWYEAASATDGDRLVQTGRRRRRLRTLREGLGRWARAAGDGQRTRAVLARAGRQRGRREVWEVLRGWRGLARHGKQVGRIGGVVAVRRRRDQGYAALAAWAAGTRERRQGERAAARARQKGEAGLQRRALEGWYEAASATDGDRLVQTGRRRRRLRTLREGLGRWARAAGYGQRTRAVLARAGRQRGRREVWEVLRGWRGLARHGKQVGRIGGVVAVRRRRDQGYAALAAWAAGTRERRQGERAAAGAIRICNLGFQLLIRDLVLFSFSGFREMCSFVSSPMLLCLVFLYLWSGRGRLRRQVQCMKAHHTVRNIKLVFRSWCTYSTRNADSKAVVFQISQRQRFLLYRKCFMFWRRQLYLNVRALYVLAEALKMNDNAAGAMHVLNHITWFQVHEGSCREYIRLCMKARGHISEHLQETCLLRDSEALDSATSPLKAGIDSPVVSARLLQLVLDANRNSASRGVSQQSMSTSVKLNFSLEEEMA
ncbi:hypothetical protein GUITHDRAFT_141442 [Guillardia theta CCMP2712]|uniref:Uncharacterized protein n=1 Tax=Guillardia theta (strain CCMP2712) TaxID=905079 RepID=L1J148_GUITC|nr:hypothetical protein GUITHDRAFT_141442 [Guillardia theta CCMP2712]EKX42246.1 hypothetical protein GUITHDRAFT_141442 [Guillardia theta CCMP2712]|eukprot:XP_005829226.1 hypothetical protein GUITHDRAFT_141442 [Guillardia theta CCMP2712]